MSTFARRERQAIVDDARAYGPEAPTLCSEWTVRDLIVHIIVRERSPMAAIGLISPRLKGFSDAAMRRLSDRPFDALLDRVADPRWSMFTTLGLDGALNTVELFVHHEDLRRAQPSWEPRDLDPADEAALWRGLSWMGRTLLRPPGVPVVVTDGGSRRRVLRSGGDPVVVTGQVGELVLFLYGRKQLGDLRFEGPADRIATLKEAQLGF